MHRRSMIEIALVSMILMAPARAVLAREVPPVPPVPPRSEQRHTLEQRLSALEQRLDAPEQRPAAGGGSFDFIEGYLPGAFVLLGIGSFCGLWARNSGRDFWLWFVGGILFNVFALISVAVYNAQDEDKKAKQLATEKPSRAELDV